MKAFKAYDIRGIYGQDLDEELAYKIGFFLPKVIQADRVLIGRDMRVHSESLFEALAQGIMDAGVNVFDAGLTTTPMIYWGTAKYEFPASIQITASHNQKEYNGFKFSGPNAAPIGYDNGLKAIEELILTQEVEPVENPGFYRALDYRDSYIDFLKAYKPDLTGLNIVIDGSNGIGGPFIRDILKKKPTYIYERPDGTFPNHDPNPLIEKNLKDLKKLVLEKQADIGIIFDGDADRVMFVDEKARFISPDLMIAFMGEYFQDRLTPGTKLIQDIRTSKSVAEYLAKYEIEMHTWRVGRAYAASKLKEIDGLYGGELAGHYYFKDFYYSDSGMLACLIVLQVMRKLKDQGIKLSERIDEISKYHSSGEINFKIEQKTEAMEAVKNHYLKEAEPDNFMDFDGYRLDYKDWWFNIRPSNTEPYLRLIAEASDKAMLDEKISEIKGIIESFK
ncbi:MAG: phosphomannomutase/phosphoglucomutase [Bacteroidales bacterium]|jgi:phosphomannomutase|nr:phosphomannomutase/phosphoglucomutase [Bacteroidales bacterium]